MTFALLAVALLLAAPQPRKQAGPAPALAGLNTPPRIITSASSKPMVRWPGPARSGSTGGEASKSVRWRGDSERCVES